MRACAIVRVICAVVLLFCAGLPVQAEDPRIAQAYAMMDLEDWDAALALGAAALEDAADDESRLAAAELLAELDFLLAGADTAAESLAAVDAQIVTQEGWQAPRRLRGLFMLAEVQRESGAPDAERQTLLRMGNLATASNDGQSLIEALNGLVPLELARGEPLAAALFAADLHGLAASIDDPALAATARQLRALAHLRLGQPAFALALLRQGNAPADDPEARAFQEELDAAAEATGNATGAITQWQAQAATLDPDKLDRDAAALMDRFFDALPDDPDTAAALAQQLIGAVATGDGRPATACMMMAFATIETDPEAAADWIACVDDYPLDYLVVLTDLSPLLDHLGDALVADNDATRKLKLASDAAAHAAILQGPHAAETLRLRLSRADVLIYLMDYEEAASEIGIAINATQDNELRETLGFDAQQMMGRLHVAQQDMQAAEAAYGAAADILRDVGLASDARWPTLLSAIAAVQGELGNYAEAEALARRALETEIAQSGADTEMTMHMRVALGGQLALAGKFGAALEQLELANAYIADNPGADQGTAVAWRMAHAAILNDLGREAEARQIMAGASQQLATQPELLQDPRMALTIYQAQSKFAWENHDVAAAAGFADRALGLLAKTDPERVAWLELKARAAFAQNDDAEALALSREINAEMRKPGRADLADAQSSLPVYVEAALRVARKSDEDEAFALMDEAFRAAQQLNALSAGSAIAAASARWESAPELARIVRQLQDAESAINALDRGYRRALADGQSGAEDDAALQLARQEYLTLQDTVAQKFPDYARTVAPQPLTVADVASWLGPDEVVVMFATSDDADGNFHYGSSVLAVSSDGVFAGSTLNRSDLGAIVSLLRCQAALTDRRCAGQAGQTRGAFSMDEPTVDAAGPGFDLDVAYLAYRALLGPVEPFLKGKKRLIVVPDAALVSLPFHTLVRTEPGPDTTLRTADWLLRDMAVFVVPTLASLDALRRQTARDHAAEARFLGVGDPLIGAQAGGPLPYVCDQMPVQQVAALSAPPDAAVMRGTLGDPRALASLAALPDTRCELQAAAAYFGADSQLLLQGAATETAIKALNASGALAQFQTISFATHGLIAGEVGDFDAGIVLTPPASATVADDGILTTGDIAQLSLNADMVMLSACNTAAGTGRNDEGLSGLASAFFYAGARSLLVSHWPVYSDAATRLTTAMLARRNADPALGYADALRLTMLDILDDPGSDARQLHPAYWAPFMVVGEGAGRL